MREVTCKHGKFVLKKEYKGCSKSSYFLFLDLDGDSIGVHFMLLVNLHRGVFFAYLLGLQNLTNLFAKRQNEIN